MPGLLLAAAAAAFAAGGWVARRFHFPRWLAEHDQGELELEEAGEELAAAGTRLFWIDPDDRLAVALARWHAARRELARRS